MFKKPGVARAGLDYGKRFATKQRSEGSGGGRLAVARRD